MRRPCQVHGAAVAVVGASPPPGARRFDASAPGPPEADAVVAPVPGFALAVLTADCAPVGLGSPEGVYAAVHVGWRGLVAGVLPRTLEVMRALGATSVQAGVGPCIGACCYEFGAADLAALPPALAAAVGARTRDGRPALDLRAGVRAQLAAGGAALALVAEDCTVCVPGSFTHRGNADEGRQALYAWRRA